jgi:hypothetical protein
LGGDFLVDVDFQTGAGRPLHCRNIKLYNNNLGWKI